MQDQTGPPPLSTETCPYTPKVPRKAKSPRGPRPKQGARLLSLRKAAGLTQKELAEFLGVPQPNIAFWEWAEKPPRSDLLPKMAKAFGVRLEELIVDENMKPLANRSGPVGELQHLFEDVRTLPRWQQRKIIEMVSAVVEQYRRKAS